METEVPRAPPARKALQPKKAHNNLIVRPNVAMKKLMIVPFDGLNKENTYPQNFHKSIIECEVTSLGEELKSVRKKMEGLRIEREETEKLLKDRDARLDSALNNVMERGEIQKLLELEVDRLYRLKQLHSRSVTIVPIRSLREKMREKMINDVKFEEDDTFEFPASELSSSPSSAAVSPSPSQSPFCMVPFGL